MPSLKLLSTLLVVAISSFAHSAPVDEAAAPPTATTLDSATLQALEDGVTAFKAQACNQNCYFLLYSSCIIGCRSDVTGICVRQCQKVAGEFIPHTYPILGPVSLYPHLLVS